MFNSRGPIATTESSMLIALPNVQADLRAGFTAARDMSSHGNGYGDVDIRNAINQGRFDGPGIKFLPWELFGEPNLETQQFWRTR
jgi:hypothetical protein